MVSKPGKNKICYVLNDSIFYYLNTFNKKTELRKTDYFGKEDKLIKSFSVGISNITYNKTNKRFYYTANNAVRKFNPNKKKSETIKYSFRYQYDKLKLNEDVFEQVWNKYGREFYDPEMHGVDWRESFHRFSEYTKYAVNTDILDKILEEMMGEVNASHTRFTPRKESDFKRLYQAYGGFELDFDNRPVVGIRFDKIYRLSKLNDPYNIRSGDILLSVDGKKITENTAIAPLFTDKAGEKIKLEIAIRDSIQTIMIKGLKYFQHKNIYYDDWVYRREQIVSELSNGRIGYVHIRYMNDRSYDKFMHDFYADNYRKDALIIDVRNNGGGNTHDKILEVLTKRSYARVSRRYFDLKKHKVPHEAWERPLALLINENSFSDAEIFPAIFQQFNLGKVVGMPTAGAVIGTNPFTLFDGSKMRLPQNGWYLPDGTNLEGAGAVPDILVEPTPEQIIADDDVQLKRVVKELLKEL